MATIFTAPIGNEGDQHRIKEENLMAAAIVARYTHIKFEIKEDDTAISAFDTTECPDEVWGLIYRFCDMYTLKSLRLTDKRMSKIVLRYLIESVLIFEFPLGEYSDYWPVRKSIISACRTHSKSFTYRTIGLRSHDPIKNEIAFEHRCSQPQLRYMGTEPWKKLATLRLDYLFVYASDLANVLRVNGRTLKSVTLYKPCLRGTESWEDFFDELREYHEAGVMKLDKLDLQGWLQWVPSESEVGVLSTEDMVTGDSFPYKVSWMVMRERVINRKGRKVGSKDPSKHTTLARAMEKYVIEGWGFYWYNDLEYCVYQGPLQGFAVVEEQVRQELYQDGWYL
ncbi:hypothetical protein EYC80_009725 [Monilinia laxa]|uniref:F-box domain-containing protein n=1 Tax=Monilinia laxa TaxID=61186 RepID=A0A5N6JYR5_MONLA|nr:hypothetical protein EYC80_009725 [Monilinia laxa]